MSLSAIIGADASELPVCLSEVWDEGLPLDDTEKRECIRLFCLLMRDRGLTEDGAKIAISEWSGNPALTESECSGAYASSKKLTCKLLQNVRYVGDRCEREFCEFPKLGKVAVSTTPSAISPGDLIEKIKTDPRAFKDHAILAVMASLKTDDLVEYDLLLEAIKKSGTGVKVATINEIVDKYISEDENAKKTAPETPEAIKKKALAIAERGDPLRYLVWQAQRNHLGDIDYQKVLISSVASAASLKSNGIQPGGNGEKGSGKSDACESVYHLMPVDRRLDGSLSPMSLFYLQQSGRIQAGMVLHSDDVEYEPIIPIYKRSTARFQKTTTHFSVTSGKNREAIELTIPPRIVWWLTSVESVANEQAFDRQYPISTDSSPAHKKRVADEIAARRARKELKLEEDEGIAVARAILADMFDNGPFKVVIPQAKEAKWLRTADFRGQEQFWDMVDALVILRWRQRKKDRDGWLIADDQDLVEAKEIHAGHKAAHFADLTEAEVRIVGIMSDGIPRTQGQLTEALGVAQSTLSERLRSIMAKSPLITEEYDHGRKTYTINHNAKKLDGDFWSGLDLINLGISTTEAYRSQQIALSVCYRYVIGLPIGIVINNSNRFPSSLSVDKKRCIEKGYPCDDCESCPLKEYLSSIYSPVKSTDNDQKQHQEPLSDTDKSDRYDTITTDNASIEHSDIPIRQTRDAKQYDDSDFVPACIASFRTAYRTDVNSVMRDFKEGDQIEVARWRAEAWQKRGIVTILESEIPPAPPADESLDSETAKSQPPQIDRLIVVRFLQDTPSFVGIDERTYGPFQAEDIASIPALQAKGLIEKGAAVEIRVGGKQ